MADKDKERQKEQIDIRERKSDLIELWDRLYRVVNNQVKSVEDGETTLRASMLKEMVQFLKLSDAVLDKLESEQYAPSDLGALDDPEDYGELPFPTSEKPAEDNPQAEPLDIE